MVHLAYILEETHNLGLMHRVNFEGSKNALEAAGRAGVKQILVASSGTAYGAWPDNPAALKEDHALNANPGFHYAVDKVKVEGLCRECTQKHPQVILSLIRPCVVYGPNVSNYLSELFDMPVLTTIRGFNPPLQFVHEDDVVKAVISILEKKGQGPFNIAPEDTITMAEICRMSGKLQVRIPYPLVRLIVGLTWASRLPMYNFSTAFLDYIRYPWVVDSGRIRNELGYRFRYSSRETVEIILRGKGILV